MSESDEKNAARPPDIWDGVQRFVEGRTFRVLLAALIVVSLLPYRSVEDWLRPFFLAVFGTELVLRLILVSKRRVERPTTETAFILVDLVALASFLPLDEIFGVPSGLLRTLRLARLFILIRFTRALAKDVYRVLTRREQLQQLGLVTSAVLALSFVSAVVLHTVGLQHDFDGQGNDGFWDQAWWAFRQVESPDNLIQSLRTDPILATASLILTIMGIFVFSYLIGLGTNIVEQVLRAERRRPVAYHDHTMVTGPQEAAERLIREFVQIYQKNRALRRFRPREVWAWLFRGDPRPRRHALPKMALLGKEPEPPSFLYEARMRWVVYREGDAAEPEALDRAAAADAKRAIFLTDIAAPGADGQTLARLAAFRGENPDAHVFLEVAQSENAGLARDVGGEGTYVLDVPRFVGLFLCHHLLVPGVDRLFAELMSAKGNEMYTHLFVDGRGATVDDADGDVDFAALARYAHEVHGITLVGGFLGEDVRQDVRGLLPADRLAPWVNPLDTQGVEYEGELVAGKLPTSTLRGIFGVSETYLPMRRCARSITRAGTRLEYGATDDPVAAALFAGRRIKNDPPAAVVVVGRNHGLRPMVDALSHFVPGIDIRVVLDDGADRGGLKDSMNLDRGGRCRVLTGEKASECAAHALSDEPAEAAVFLSDPRESDPDAQNALRVLRFVRAAPVETRMRILVEIGAMHRGEALERNVARLAPGRFDLTFVSTGEISNFFMVHGAFVPGVMALYERLLGTRGDELVFIPVSSETGRVEYRALRDVLATHRCILLGVDLESDGLVLNGAPDRVIELRNLRGVFAITDISPRTSSAGVEPDIEMS